MSLSLIVLLAFLACVPLGLLGRLPEGARPVLAALVPGLLLVLVLGQASGLGPDGALTDLAFAAPSVGYSAAFRLDGLSLLFAGLITGIGVLIFVFAGHYLRGHPLLTRFTVILGLFAASMLGAVLADDVILLFVFWELTSLTSFLLIGFKHADPNARKSALQGLLVTVGGGLSLLAGLILIAAAAGTTRISEILAMGPALAASPLADAAIVLIAIGAFAKSAQAPLHFWLPNAMAAPTPVSAYLHSATMVKLGVYLLARFNPVFGASDLWVNLLIGCGALTMLIGAVLALRETDLKRVLAYSTMVALGTLVVLIGLEDSRAAVAAVTFLVVHALYKACLFMVAGIIDHETGSRDASLLSGLWRAMPITAVVAGLGSLSMAGLPPFVGFVAKELLYEAKLASALPMILACVAVVVNAAMVVVAGVVALRPFLGRRSPTPRAPHDPGAGLWLGPAILAVAGLALGLFPNLVAETIIQPAASAILGTPITVTLKLWHGFNLVFWISFATVAVGVVLFLAWPRLQPGLARIAAIDENGPEAAYRRGILGFQVLAARQTQALQTGSLRHYLALTLLIVALSVGGVLLASDGLRLDPPDSIAAHEVLICVILVGGALLSCFTSGVFAWLMAASLVGFGSAVLFLMMGAPDLAFTQFAVETLFVVLVVAVLARLPFRARDPRRLRHRARDAALAGLVGVVGSALLLTVLAQPFDPFISTWFGETALPEALGRNVVNVIIVDFRALDTLGEIAVLGLAALAAYAVMRNLRGDAQPLSRGDRP